jgi:hypothetical protein
MYEHRGVPAYPLVDTGTGLTRTREATENDAPVRNPIERTSHTRPASGLAILDGTKPMSASAWKTTMRTATESAMKPSDMAVRPAVCRSVHSRRGTGCFRAAISSKDRALDEVRETGRVDGEGEVWSRLTVGHDHAGQGCRDHRQAEILHELVEGGFRCVVCPRAA